MEGKEALADNGPAPVAVRVITQSLTGKHEGGEEERMAAGAACRGEKLLESFEQVQCVVGHGLGHASAVQRVRDELCQWRGGLLRGAGPQRRLIGGVARAAEQQAQHTLAQEGYICARAGTVAASVNRLSLALRGQMDGRQDGHVETYVKSHSTGRVVCGPRG